MLRISKIAVVVLLSSRCRFGRLHNADRDDGGGVRSVLMFVVTLSSSVPILLGLCQMTYVWCGHVATLPLRTAG